MSTRYRTLNSVALPDRIHRRLQWWVLFMGDRLAVAALIAVGFALGIWSLVTLDVLAVGPTSKAATVFASGLTAGVITVVTIALSINQLILSRVFDAPDELSDRLAGTRDLRETVEDLAGEPASPNEPAAFLQLLAEAIQERATALERALAAADWDQPEDVTVAIREIREYGEHMHEHVEGEDHVVDVLSLLLGRGYARNTTAIRHIRKRHREQLPAAARAELDAVEELLESVAVVRQFFKTLAIQQDFARLSRLMVYTGLLALGASVSATLFYRTGSTTIDPSLLPLAVSLALGVVVSPVAVFTAYILRAATVGRRTVAAGAFVPSRAR